MEVMNLFENWLHMVYPSIRTSVVRCGESKKCEQNIRECTLRRVTISWYIHAEIEIVHLAIDWQRVITVSQCVSL